MSVVSLQDKLLGVVAMLIITVTFSAVVLAVGYTGRGHLADSNRAACRLAILDRLDTIRVRSVQMRAALRIARDPFQSAQTRRARGLEARALHRSIVDLGARIDPAHGGRLVCQHAFPNPSLLP